MLHNFHVLFKITCYLFSVKSESCGDQDGFSQMTDYKTEDMKPFDGLDSGRDLLFFIFRKSFSFTDFASDPSMMGNSGNGPNSNMGGPNSNSNAGGFVPSPMGGPPGGPGGPGGGPPPPGGGPMSGGPMPGGPMPMGGGPMPGGPMPPVGPPGGPLNAPPAQPLASNVLGKGGDRTMDQQYMQQSSQLYVFSTEWANKGAEALHKNEFPSIIAWHESQPQTKKHLEVRSNLCGVDKDMREMYFFCLSVHGSAVPQHGQDNTEPKCPSEPDEQDDEGPKGAANAWAWNDVAWWSNGKTWYGSRWPYGTRRTHGWPTWETSQCS